MKEINWDTLQFRCHYLGDLMTDPIGKSPMQKFIDAKQGIEDTKAKYDKLGKKDGAMGIGYLKTIEDLTAALPELEAGKDVEILSTTCQKRLVEIYWEEKYGKKSTSKLRGNKFTKKGLMVEEDSLDLISIIEGRPINKNEERVFNKWFKGTPDGFDGRDIMAADWIHDAKSNWDAITFGYTLIEDLKSMYLYQGNGYCDITGANGFTIHQCLISCPEPLLNDEKRKLLNSMPDAATEDNPEYKEAELELVSSLTFDEIPLPLRHFKYTIKRDDYLIIRMRSRMEQCRRWLKDYEKIHIGLA